MNNNNEIVKISFQFSLEIVSYCEKLEADKKFIIDTSKYYEITFKNYVFH